MHHGTGATHVPWCMSGSLTRCGGKNIPGITGACATYNVTYLVRGKWLSYFSMHTLRVLRLWVRCLHTCHSFDNQINPVALSYQGCIKTWTCNVKWILKYIGTKSLFVNIKACDLNVITEKSCAWESDKWERRRYLKPRLRLYNIFKPILSQEEYVVSIISQYQRSLLV